jgi:hypothetical protein
VWNPGQLSYHLTIPKPKKPHGLFPTNLLLTESLYLAGYIERMGTGIPDKPTSPEQKYRLTAKGKALQQRWKNQEK